MPWHGWPSTLPTAANYRFWPSVPLRQWDALDRIPRHCRPSRRHVARVQVSNRLPRPRSGIDSVRHRLAELELQQSDAAVARMVGPIMEYLPCGTPFMGLADVASLLWRLGLSQGAGSSMVNCAGPRRASLSGRVQRLRRVAPDHVGRSAQAIETRSWLHSSGYEQRVGKAMRVRQWRCDGPKRSSSYLMETASQRVSILITAKQQPCAWVAAMRNGALCLRPVRRCVCRWQIDSPAGPLRSALIRSFGLGTASMIGDKSRPPCREAHQPLPLTVLEMHGKRGDRVG